MKIKFFRSQLQTDNIPVTSDPKGTLAPGEDNGDLIINTSTRLGKRNSFFLKFDPSAELPSLKFFNSKMAYISMPSLSFSIKNHLDSILHSDSVALSNASIFVFDFRNNLGGNVNVFDSLISFLNTPKFKYCDAYDLANNNVITGYKEAVADTTISYFERDKYSQYLKLLTSNIGKVIVDSSGSDLRGNYNFQKEQPKIFIIANALTCSAAEIMILNFKKYFDTKIIGESTSGTMNFGWPTKYNIENFAYISLPNQKIAINVSYESEGIKPDFSIQGNEDLYTIISYTSKL
jgi:Peptidase family S41